MSEENVINKMRVGLQEAIKRAEDSEKKAAESEKKKEDYKKGYFDYRHRWDERNRHTQASGGSSAG